jgi:hypothetical protein
VHTGPLDGVDHRAGLLDRARERLLADQVLARRRGEEREPALHLRRYGEGDRVTASNRSSRSV